MTTMTTSPAAHGIATGARVVVDHQGRRHNAIVTAASRAGSYIVSIEGVETRVEGVQIVAFR